MSWLNCCVVRVSLKLINSFQWPNLYARVFSLSLNFQIFMPHCCLSLSLVHLMPMPFHISASESNEGDTDVQVESDSDSILCCNSAAAMIQFILDAHSTIGSFTSSHFIILSIYPNNYSNPRFLESKSNWLQFNNSCMNQTEDRTGKFSYLHSKVLWCS